MNFIPALDNGIQNLKLTFSCPLFTTPTIISGFAPQTVIEIDDVTNTVNRIGADGLMSTAVIPVLVRGRINLQFNSIGAGVFRTLQQQTSRTGISYPGTLEVTKIGILPFTITFNNFTLLDGFKGLSTAQGIISDAVFNFEATLPDGNILSDLTNIAALGLSLVQGIL